MVKVLLSLFTAVTALSAYVPAPVMASAVISNGDVVWQESFEDCSVGSSVLNDADHWSCAEVRGSDASKINFTANIAGNSGHKYLKIGANVKDNQSVAKAAAVIVGTNHMSSFGLEQDKDFTISYDFKSEFYNADTMYSSTNNKYTEYYHSVSDSSDYSDSASIQMFFHHKAAAANKTTFYTDTSGKASENLKRLCGSDASFPSGRFIYSRLE